MIMWICAVGRLDKSLALWTTILSAPSKVKKKTFFLFSHYQSQSPPIYLCQREISLTVPHGIGSWGAGGSILRPSAGPQGWGERKNPSAPPCGTAKSNRSGRNPHPLVQTHLRVPSQCCLIDSDCVRGLGAVYTECQASARRMSVRTGMVEGAVSDVGG